MKKEKNRIVYGKYLIEHAPLSSDDDPWHVWDLATIFHQDAQEFRCRTRVEAEELCKALNALKGA